MDFSNSGNSGSREEREREGRGSELASQLADVMVECRRELCMRKELMAELQQLSGQRNTESTNKLEGKQQQQKQEDKDAVPVKAHGHHDDDDDKQNTDEEDDGIVVVAPQGSWAKDERDAKMKRFMRRMYYSSSSYSTVLCAVGQG